VLSLRINQIVSGRVVNVADDGAIYVGRKYRLFRANAEGSAGLTAWVACPAKRRLVEKSRLLCRLFRHEIRGAVVLADGSKVVATRQGLYYGAAGEVALKPARLPQLSPPVKPPMTITGDSQDRILWGEYWGNAELREVRLLVSTDQGRSYEPFFAFQPGEVKHVHNIIEDVKDNCYWVTVGDHDCQPGIGRLSRDLKHFDWLVKGEQKYRAVVLFTFADRLVYATDSEKEPNCICTIDKKTAKWEKLCDTPGSCIHGARFGRWYAVSTGVESFEGFDTNEATLWISANAQDWQQVWAVRKDIWSKKYFQLGVIVLPRGQWDHDLLVFSGQAVRKYDNVVCTAEVLEE